MQRRGAGAGKWIVESILRGTNETVVIVCSFNGLRAEPSRKPTLNVGTLERIDRIRKSIVKW